MVLIYRCCLKKERVMDNPNPAKQSKSKVTSNKKRKWREIEQLKEQFQLAKELRIYENSLEYMLEDF
jgi:uncharacterized protein DUF3545